ncbi:hypothetical protein Ahy_A07g033254 isoform D [Arachis hypogaea]|uniref:Uncharacterized protein n=1 Tax=Arachis hypogaea TaxID=3818 RepID=A0A445C8T5_ARAHY|nr:hypothetical protein Ahy_A07g033254 isoform D [Arachis hypogaea]
MLYRIDKYFILKMWSKRQIYPRLKIGYCILKFHLFFTFSCLENRLQPRRSLAPFKDLTNSCKSCILISQCLHYFGSIHHLISEGIIITLLIRRFTQMVLINLFSFQEMTEEFIIQMLLSKFTEKEKKKSLMVHFIGQIKETNKTKRIEEDIQKGKLCTFATPQHILVCPNDPS